MRLSRVQPALLADFGIAAALRAAARHPTARATISDGGIDRHPPAVEDAVLFTALQALKNASKHGHGAARAVVTLTEGEQLRFTVADDGGGFDATQVREGRGTATMCERLAAVGGVLKIESRRGLGTIVTGAVPLAAVVPQPRPDEARHG